MLKRARSSLLGVSAWGLPASIGMLVANDQKIGPAKFDTKVNQNRHDANVVASQTSVCLRKIDAIARLASALVCVSVMALTRRFRVAWDGIFEWEEAFEE